MIWLNAFGKKLVLSWKGNNIGNRDNPRNNSEGYADPTAYEGTKNIIKEENLQQKRITELMYVLRYITDKAGFEIKNRITFVDKKTGKEYR